MRVMLKTGSTVFLFLATIASAFAAGEQQAASARRPAITPVASHAPGVIGPAEQTALVKQYCVTCHNDRSKAGQLSLQSFDAAKLEEHGELTEKMIRKLRSGMMPPSGARRPEPAELTGLLTVFESRMDRHAALNPNPGSRPFQRLNRAEYANAVRD
ncbi:MAG: c-type cytochrome domain-containing protein, partial [Vicinamibacterales bacterium]